MEFNSIPAISERETEVLKLVAEGITDKEIALKLFISTSTAVFHRKNLKDKLNCKNTAELIYKATKFNLI